MNNSMTIRDRVHVRVTVGDGFRFGVGVFVATLFCTVLLYVALAVGGLSILALVDRAVKNQDSQRVVAPR